MKYVRKVSLQSIEESMLEQSCCCQYSSKEHKHGREANHKNTNGQATQLAPSLVRERRILFSGIESWCHCLHHEIGQIEVVILALVNSQWMNGVLLMQQVGACCRRCRKPASSRSARNPDLGMPRKKKHEQKMTSSGVRCKCRMTHT